MSAVISQIDAEKLARPHVARVWFARLDLPFGTSYLHSDIGRITIGGHEYFGVTDPIGGRLVSIGQVDEPQFGQAAAVTIMLTGVDRKFIAEVLSSARDIEGRTAAIFWAAFDAETLEQLTGLIPLFPRGKMTAPSIKWQGIGVRSVSVTIESLYQAKNFPPGGRWNDADQERRFPGDKGLSFIGVNISENWQ